MELTSVLSSIHQQLTHVASQLEGDLAAPAVMQIKANMTAELDRLAQQAEEIAAKVIAEIEARVAGRLASAVGVSAPQAPEPPKQAQTTGKPAETTGSVTAEPTPNESTAAVVD